MVAYTFRMTAGIPGEVNRIFDSAIEAAVITPFGTTGAPSAYGVPLVMDAVTGHVRTLAAADTGVYGWLVRPYPTGPSYGGSVGAGAALGTSVPPVSGTCDVLVSGYIHILLGGSVAAVKGAPVFVWTAVSATGHVQGTVEAVAAGASTIQVPGAYFMGPADASGITEIAVNP